LNLLVSLQIVAIVVHEQMRYIFKAERFYTFSTVRQKYPAGSCFVSTKWHKGSDFNSFECI